MRQKKLFGAACALLAPGPWVDYTQKKKKEVQTMKEKNIERLYKLLNRAEREHDTDAAAALRWVIFALEND